MLFFVPLSLLYRDTFSHPHHNNNNNNNNNDDDDDEEDDDENHPNPNPRLCCLLPLSIDITPYLNHSHHISYGIGL